MLAAYSSSLFPLVCSLLFKKKDDFRNHSPSTRTGGSLFFVELPEVQRGDYKSVMEQLDAKLNSFPSFRTLFFAKFADAC